MTVKNSEKTLSKTEDSNDPNIIMLINNIYLFNLLLNFLKL